MKSSRTPKAVAARMARAEQARQSRLTIMRAARDCYAEAGYHATSMATIAERAGVAPQTVSYHFGTKPRLTSELILATIMFELDPPPAGTREEWVGWMLAATDATELLRRFAVGGMAILSRVAVVLAALRDGAGGDEELAEQYRRHEAHRREEHRNVITWFVERGWLRPGLDPETALDLLVSIWGFEHYLAYKLERGWDDDRIAAHLHRLLVAALTDAAPLPDPDAWGVSSPS